MFSALNMFFCNKKVCFSEGQLLLVGVVPWCPPPSTLFKTLQYGNNVRLRQTNCDAHIFDARTDLIAQVLPTHQAHGLACLLVDEAQFLTPAQVWQLSVLADDYNLPVMCYGLRTDFQGKLFPGSAELLAIADVLREIRTICHCGRKASMVVRQSGDGTIVTDGAQIEIGGNDKYVSLCRKHWKEATGYEQQK